jgi:hypothetical protein
MNCTQILKECNFGTPNKQSANTASKWLKKNGYQKNWKKEYFVKFKLSTDNVVDLEKVKSKNFGRL